MNFVGDLLQAVPELRGIYDEHIKDNDALLPHVFFGDITRFVIAEAHNDKGSAALVRLLHELERGLRDESAEVKELIAVSFIENLCGEEEAIRVLKPLMGDNLKRELATFCGESRSQ